MREALARRLDRRNPAQAVIQILIDVVLHAGRGAVELALYTLLPIMVVMMILLRPWGSCISSSLTGSLQRKRSPHGLAGVSGHSQCRHVERCGPFARNKPLQQRRRHFSKARSIAFRLKTSVAPSNNASRAGVRSSLPPKTLRTIGLFPHEGQAVAGCVKAGPWKLTPRTGLRN
jgi:hypothetical protein